MKKIIITYDDKITEEEAMAYITSVIKDGRVSEDTKGRKHYCWVTSWHKSKTVVYVRNKRNENSPDSFIIKKEE